MEATQDYRGPGRFETAIGEGIKWAIPATIAETLIYRTLPQGSDGITGFIVGCVSWSAIAIAAQKGWQQADAAMIDHARLTAENNTLKTFITDATHAGRTNDAPDKTTEL